jgi:hypothetical protein
MLIRLLGFALAAWAIAAGIGFGILWLVELL